MTDPFDLSGRVAVVTGSTRGIGLAIALLLLARGATVIISSESAVDTSTTAARIGAMGIPCNVGEGAAIDRLVDGAISQCGGIDILVCNAGIAGRAGSWSLADFDAVMAVNLRSMVALCERTLPYMAGRPGAAAVLVSSIAGLRGNAGINAYALAKAGVAQLARNLAVQWGPHGVRVNALAPGLIDTEFSRGLKDDPAFMARRMAMTPLRRAGTPEEVAAAALFLASPAGGFVTGHTLVVDGGTVISDGS